MALNEREKGRIDVWFFVCLYTCMHASMYENKHACMYGGGRGRQNVQQCIHVGEAFKSVVVAIY